MKQNGILLYGLLPAVIVGTLALAYYAGIWVIVSVYFYWQWFHYARQSWGISKAYRSKQPDALYEDGWLDQAIFYSLPVLGILYRSNQAPTKFIGLDLRVIPVADWIVTVAAVATVVLMAYWFIRRFQAAREGRLNATHALYLMTHYFMFTMGYIAIADISFGWLFVNIWHNAQYILFVWMYNTKRFKGGIDPNAKFLSYISQPQRLGLYLAVCIGITGVLYGILLGALEALWFQTVAGTIVLYQIVNFHHYIVDSRIWKVRKGEVKKTLAVEG